MIRRAHVLALVAPLLAVTLSGCGVWDAWRYRTGHPSQHTAYEAPSTVQPGYSTDAGVDSRGRSSSTADSPKPLRSMQRLVPPAVPPAHADRSPSNLDQPIAEQDARLRPTPDEESRLIRTLKTPRVLTPDSVRSIYDRFRNTEDEQSTTEKPVGPIARIYVRESEMVTCQYSDADALMAGPVELGRPEFDGNVTPAQPPPLGEDVARCSTDYPAVMQASPSSFKHPLLADPTGVPYGIR